MSLLFVEGLAVAESFRGFTSEVLKFLQTPRVVYAKKTEFVMSVTPEDLTRCLGLMRDLVAAVKA